MNNFELNKFSCTLKSCATETVISKKDMSTSCLMAHDEFETREFKYFDGFVTSCCTFLVAEKKTRNISWFDTSSSSMIWYG